VLRRKDVIEINLGHSQEQMERTKKQYKIAALTQSEIQMVISVKGFDTTAPIGGPDIKPDVDAYPAWMFPSKYNMSQFVTSRHVVPKSAIVKKTVKTESQEEVAKKKIGEAYSMEERMNPKEFQRTSSVKLTSRGGTLEWYDIMVAHGEMNGMFIPPHFSITPELIMVNLWTKRPTGETIHARRKTMSNHLHKILMTEDMFSKDCQDEYREIVREDRGDGYAALHNIMRLHHPRLTERRVDTKYPSQSITARFTQHVTDVQEHIDREAVRGRLYSRYDSLQLVLDTLHPSYHMKLKQRCEQDFRHDHDMEEDLPFTLQMPQLGTSLTMWADELKLSDIRPARVSHVALQEIEESAPLVHAIGQMGPCSLCDGPHTETSCHKFINHIMGEQFLREKEAIVKQIKRENTTFIKPRSMVGPRTSTVRLIEAPLISLDQNPDTDADDPSNITTRVVCRFPCRDTGCPR
jgi:hypothetical protein